MFSKIFEQIISLNINLKYIVFHRILYIDHHLYIYISMSEYLIEIYLFHRIVPVRRRPQGSFVLGVCGEEGGGRGQLCCCS